MLSKQCDDRFHWKKKKNWPVLSYVAASLLYSACKRTFTAARCLSPSLGVTLVLPSQTRTTWNARFCPKMTQDIKPAIVADSTDDRFCLTDMCQSLRKVTFHTLGPFVLVYPITILCWLLTVLPNKLMDAVICIACGPGFFIFYRCLVGSRDGVVGIATRYGLEGPGIESRWGRNFPHVSRPPSRPAQPSIQWVPDLSLGKGGRGVVLTTPLHLVCWGSRKGYSP